ncbi:MAG: hypothetical protein J5I93_02570 [Pirellulaceae bacterium]|nr:hypothetical protein [Pirellulaceae bacterium]
MTYGWLSLLPPLVAIGLAIATRRVVLSLALGVFMGAVLLDPHWQPLASYPAPTTWAERMQFAASGASTAVVASVSAVPAFFEHHLWASLSDADHLRVFCFTLLMGAMIGVIHRSGGMHAAVAGLAPLARSRRGGQLMTWTLGLLVFIDDYANSLLLGNTMRPLADRLKISREKLAYLVDSTAAPVSGLALVSTWVAGEIGYIEAGFQDLGLDPTPSGFAIFIDTIPYRFYVLWALLLIPMIAILGRDFGPMLRAERRRVRENDEEEPAIGERAGVPGETAATSDDPAALAGVPQRWYNAAGPIAVALLATLLLLAVTGYQAISAESTGEEIWQRGAWRGAVEIVGQANSYVALLYGALAGLVAAAVMVRAQRIMSPGQVRKAAFDGARLVLPALTILWLAWALSETTDSQHLGTGQYLGSLISDPRPPEWLPAWIAAGIHQLLSPRWMPTIVFVLSSVVAFSTGTSWGTMGILMPIVVSTTYQMLAGEGDADPTHPLLIATIGSVLAGAIFGDHCSPISDTTVLSAQASGCDHMAHVRTQMPYALFVAAVSILCGTLPVGLGWPLWLMLPLGVVAMAGGLLVWGRRV